MPRLDALGLLHALASDYPRPPVVVYRSQNDAGLNAWLREAGAVAVLPRAVTAKALVAHLSKLLALA